MRQTHYKRKILIFSIYPIKNPKSGGEKRVDAFMKYYAQKGFEVKHVGVFCGLFNPQYSKDDLPFWGNLAKESMLNPHYEVFVTARAYYEDTKIKRKIIKKIKQFLPDIIQIENAYPYIGLRKILKEIDFRGKIFYSSHNIEYKMKEELFLQMGEDKASYSSSIEKIKKAETELVKKAHLTIATTLADSKILKKMGANKILLCSNGVFQRKSKEKERHYWEKVFKKKGIKKIALFVGGFHIPNWYGFYKMIGLGLGFLPDYVRIGIAGTMSPLFHKQLESFKYDIAATTFKKRACLIGDLTEDKLQGLIDFSDTILLPIISGGGSNLKTAEALIANKKIVATSFAFRGFEHLKKVKNLIIKDEPKAFRQAIVTSLKLPKVSRSTEEKKKIEGVLWKNCFKGLEKEIDNL